MDFRGTAIICSARASGETTVSVRMLTEEHGLVQAYIAGGRGRHLRPVLMRGNVVQAEVRQGHGNAYARVEPEVSRGAWLGEPLPIAAINWATALTAASLPERHAYPPLFQALGGLLDAFCYAPSARGWMPGLLMYEALLLREIGYGAGEAAVGENDDWAAVLAAFDRGRAALNARVMDDWWLAEPRGSVIGARDLLRQRLARIA